MNDFELQRRLRELRGPVEPARDLFPGIAARVAAEAAAVQRAPVRRGGGFRYAVAAAIVASVSIGLGIQLYDRPAGETVVSVPHPSKLPGMNDVALARAPGGDPLLAGASMVLDSAQDQIEQALAERPDAVFLVSLMNRTQSQRMKLERLSRDAG